VIKVLNNRPDCLVQVYDRSGKLVFQDDQFYEPWDGTYLNLGEKLPAGTYFYMVLIDRQDTNKPAMRGTVTILR
jgi:gliding motility-associated-like protein